MSQALMSLESAYADVRTRKPQAYIEVAGMTISSDFDSRMHAGELGDPMLRISTGDVWRYQTARCCEELVLIEVHPANFLPGKGHATVHGLNAAKLARGLQEKFGGAVYIDGKPFAARP